MSFEFKGGPMDTILSKNSVSVTELKRNYASILAQADDEPVAVLNHNRPEAYLVPAAYFERLLNQLEDLEDAKLAQERANGPFIDISPDAL
jgi:antitoxin StbD